MRPALVALWVCAAGALASPARAQPAATNPAVAGVAVSGVWARATAGAGTTGVVYATITASQPDRLTGASTPVAAMAEVHRSDMADGVMEMRPVQGGLPVSPGAPAQLQPGGYHIMLMGLKQPLHQGDHFPVAFTFEHGGTVTAQAVVAAPGATTPSAAMPMPIPAPK